MVAAIGFQMTNVFIGAYMGFVKRVPSLLRIHRLLYFTVLLCLLFFLVLNEVHGDNTIGEYLVGLYFITIIPLSKRWDILLHAVFSVVGLTLLPLVIVLQFI